MARTDQLQSIWHRYERDHASQPASALAVVRWAIDQKLIHPPRVDPVALLADDLSRAMRGEYATDERGRRYRKNHAVRISRNGVQTTLWAELGSAPLDHMRKAFAQRRNQIVGDCYQLRVDVDVYNEKHQNSAPIQMILDFTDDVAERLAVEELRAAA